MAESGGRIRKFVEYLGLGRVTDRVAYVLEESNLPIARRGTEWREDKSFDENMAARDRGFPLVIQAVQRNGHATVYRTPVYQLHSPRDRQPSAA